MVLRVGKPQVNNLFVESRTCVDLFLWLTHEAGWGGSAGVKWNEGHVRDLDALLFFEPDARMCGALPGPDAKCYRERIRREEGARLVRRVEGLALDPTWYMGLCQKLGQLNLTFRRAPATHR